MHNDKRSMIVLLLIVFAFCIFLWIIFPNVIVTSSENFVENFDESKQPANKKVVEAQIDKKIVADNSPLINPLTGALIDGPGFEKNPEKQEEITGADILSQTPSNYYFLDDGADGEMSIQHNLCSKSCCSEQWPTPFKQKYDPYVCGNKNQFVPSNIMCNNTFQDSGCLCLTKNQSRFLSNRGGNGRELF